MKKNNVINKEIIILIFGLSIILFFLFCSFMPRIFTRYDLKEMFAPWQKSSAEHLFGTNDIGYDIFTETVYASGTTLTVGFFAAFISLIIGTFIGMFSGYSSGFAGKTCDVLTQIFLLIPMIPMAVVLAAYVGPGTLNIIITISIMGWCATAKAVKAETVRLRSSDFIMNMKLMGYSEIHIILKHILPNLSNVIAARFVMTTATAMITEASLSFLGLGNTENITWGTMISFAYGRGGFSKGAVLWFTAPGVCITMCIIALYCINYYIESRNDVVDGITQIKEY